MKQFDFKTAVDKTRAEATERELERLADEFLLKRKIARDGRPLSEKRMSVKPLYNNNGRGMC